MQRQYEAPNFQVRDTRQFQSSGVAQADTRPAGTVSVGDDTWRSKLLEGFGNQAANVLNKMADVEFSNLYLEGQAQAGMIESEDELQGNPLTRDWKVAGYRDTMGKLALADSEAQFSADLKTLREKNPEDFQAYLAQRRNKIMPGLASMSREARAAAAGQMLLQDRAATKQWTSEHAKFIIEQKSQAVHTQWNTSMRTLSKAQLQSGLGELKPEDFNEQLRSTTGTMVGSVWMDNSLPQDVKKQLTFEMMQSALANDNVALYEYVQNNAIPDAAGGAATTLIARLEGEQQTKLANGYREAMQRTSDARNLYRMEQIANLESQIDNDMYKGTYSELTGLLNPMVLNKAITGERREALINKFLDKQHKSEVDSGIADMYSRGDINGIFAAGKTAKDGLDAMDRIMAKRGVSPEQRLQTYLTAGLNGMDGGFNKAGEVLGVALRQVRSPDGTVLPQHLATVRTINDAVRKAEDRGQTGVRVALLAGLSEPDRMFAERVFKQVDGGASYDEAVLKATDTESKEAQQTPAVRAAATQQTSQAVTKEIMAMESRGVLSTGWTWAKSIFSDNAASDLKLRPWSSVGDRDGWFSDGPTVQFYTQRVREELAQEASAVLLTNPSADADQVIRVAKANVAARTISTKFGPLTMPRNLNLETAFGVGKGNQAAIGPALDAMLKETKEDANWQLSFVNGRLFAQEFDRQGVRVGTGNFVQPSAISTKIKELTDKQQEQANNVMGAGRRVSNPDGVTVVFNGMNTAGVPMNWMYGFRDNLIAHEGVRSKPYADLSGLKDTKGNPIMTVGVGVSSHNARYPKVKPDGTVDPRDIQRSFIDASNDAAIVGAKVSRDLGVSNQHSFMLMSELAYQSGVGFLSQQNKTGDRYREFTAAFQSRNVQQAQDAFKRTAAWYYSADPKDRSKVTTRQQNYLRLIEQSLK